jgi:hypothetical protein
VCVYKVFFFFFFISIYIPFISFIYYIVILVPLVTFNTLLPVLYGDFMYFWHFVTRMLQYNRVQKCETFNFLDIIHYIFIILRIHFCYFIN